MSVDVMVDGYTCGRCSSAAAGLLGGGARLHVTAAVFFVPGDRCSVFMIFKNLCV